MGFRGWPQPLLHVLCCTESTIFEFRRWLRTYPLTNNARRVGETFKIMRSPPGHSKIFARSNGARGAHQNSFGRIASRAVRPKQMQWARAQAALRRAAVLRRDVRPVAALRRRPPARLVAARFSFAVRVGFALRLLFVIFAMGFSLSFSRCHNGCPHSNRYY